MVSVKEDTSPYMQHTVIMLDLWELSLLLAPSCVKSQLFIQSSRVHHLILLYFFPMAVRIVLFGQSGWGQQEINCQVGQQMLYHTEHCYNCCIVSGLNVDVNYSIVHGIGHEMESQQLKDLVLWINELH